MLTENQDMPKAGWQARYLIMARVIQAQAESLWTNQQHLLNKRGPSLQHQDSTRERCNTERDMTLTTASLI